MASDGNGEGPQEGGSGGDERGVEDLVAYYTDRLIAGERLEAREILAAHPGLGDEIVDTLEVFAHYTHCPLESSEDASGSVVGCYKLLQKIGEGAYGVVYMAEQEEPLQRRVAVKVIKAGMDTKEVIGRFEAERQALAMMDHPNIAKVLDAGATEAGRPYFVMELSPVAVRTALWLIQRLAGYSTGIMPASSTVRPRSSSTVYPAADDQPSLQSFRRVMDLREPRR